MWIELKNIRITTGYINCGCLRLALKSSNGALDEMGDEQPHVISYGIKYESLKRIDSCKFEYRVSGYAESDGELIEIDESVIIDTTNNVLKISGTIERR